METKVTAGVSISIRTQYKELYSNPYNYQFLFAYFVTIENRNDFTVQLLRRHWHIFDSSGEYREVEGQGVIGQQPILEPGDLYEYESACNLVTDMGKMHGSYLFEKVIDGKQFEVAIPEFHLVPPFRAN
jgi:ApaG protein